MDTVLTDEQDNGNTSTDPEDIFALIRIESSVITDSQMEGSYNALVSRYLKPKITHQEVGLR
jgi:hypothetical protein